MKRFLKNCRRKRREHYAKELGNDLSFHLKFLKIPSSNHKPQISKKFLINSWKFVLKKYSLNSHIHPQHLKNVKEIKIYSTMYCKVL